MNEFIAFIMITFFISMVTIGIYHLHKGEAK